MTQYITVRALLGDLPIGTTFGWGGKDYIILDETIGGMIVCEELDKSKRNWLGFNCAVWVRLSPEAFTIGLN